MRHSEKLSQSFERRGSDRQGRKIRRFRTSVIEKVENFKGFESVSILSKSGSWSSRKLKGSLKVIWNAIWRSIHVQAFSKHLGGLPPNFYNQKLTSALLGMRASDFLSSAHVVEDPPGIF